MKFPFVSRKKYETRKLVSLAATRMAALLMTEFIAAQSEIESLKKQLAQAQKNDSPRDEKTGRFTKRGSV